LRERFMSRPIDRSVRSCRSTTDFVRPRSSMTFLQIANRDSGAAVDAKCFLENHNRHCDDSDNVCLDDIDCPPSYPRRVSAV
jgi:hypothetical protein